MSASLTPHNTAIALLLGADDQPTDGVSDYSERLAAALEDIGRNTVILRVDWKREGWLRALIRTRTTLNQLRPAWIVLNHTHMAWSRRGFPLMTLAVVMAIRSSRCKLLLLLHDPLPFPGHRLIDRVRRTTQVSVLHAASLLADQIVTTIEPRLVPWLPKRARSRLIPVGSNIAPVQAPRESPHDTFRIAVFGITEGSKTEPQLLAEVARRAADRLGGVSLQVFGRGSREAENDLARALGESGVALAVHGLVAESRAGELLASADCLLFVRGGASSRRGTIAAAIANGLPVVAPRGPETAWPITEAGILLTEDGTAGSLAEAVSRIGGDIQLRAGLRGRNEAAYQRYFTWERIARAIDELAR